MYKISHEALRFFTDWQLSINACNCTLFTFTFPTSDCKQICLAYDEPGCVKGYVTLHIIQPAANVPPILVPERKFSHVHMDLVWTPSNFRVQRDSVFFSLSWQVSEVAGSSPYQNFKTISAVDCADAVIASWIASFGVPATLGTQFTSAVWTILCFKLGVSQSLKVPQHENFSLSFCAQSETIWACH